MKSALTVVLFRLFLIGVFADGKETSNGESVSVLEGDSVTLKSGVTDVQTDDEIEWRFSGSRIATISIDPSEISVWVKSDGSFKDRLQLDKETGDLKISNIRTTDSGLYKVKISSTDGSQEITFTVKVLPADEVKPVTVEVTVLEGDSVSLNTDPTYIQQRDDVIQWRFGQQKSPEAEIINTSDERFRDRLKADSKTGSLNITNIRTTDAGLYEADISSSRYTIHKSFNVTVSDEMKSPSVKEGESVTLQTVTEIQNDDLIHWMFGDTVIAEIHKADRRFFTSDVPDRRFRGRLYLDHQTGSLKIINTRTTDSGDYQLKISSSRRTINRRITVTALSDPCLCPVSVAAIVLGVVVVVVVVMVVVVVFLHHRKISTLEKKTENLSKKTMGYSDTYVNLSKSDGNYAENIPNQMNTEVMQQYESFYEG